MARTLKATFSKNCIGCELCVVAAQKQLEKVGLEGSPIRIFKNKNDSGRINYSVDLDPSVNELDIEKVEQSCPALVFTLEEEGNELTS